MRSIRLSKLGTLENWKRRPPATKMKATPRSFPKMTVIPIIESDSEDSISESFHTDEEDPPVPPIRQSRSANSCGNCNHQRSNGPISVHCLLQLLALHGLPI